MEVDNQFFAYSKLTLAALELHEHCEDINISITNRRNKILL